MKTRILFVGLLCVCLGVSVAWAGEKPTTDCGMSDQIVSVSDNEFFESILLVKTYEAGIGVVYRCDSRAKAAACWVTAIMGQARGKCNLPGKPYCKCSGCDRR